MTGTGVAIVQRAIAAVNSITSYHFLFTSHEYSGDDYEVEGNVIAANPAREVDTITERKAGKQTQRTIMIIGASAWDYKDGQWVTHQSTGWFDPLMLSETAKLLFEHITIADYLGDATLDGQPVYHLALTYASPPAGEIWIGTTNYYPYLLQGESGTGDQRAHVTMKFSRFNDPAIKIAPP